MSMLRMQTDELRKLAGIARGYAEVDARENGRALLFESAEAMREAADTIESLRNRLQELQGVGGWECEVTSHYYYDDYDLHEFEFSCGHAYTTHEDMPYPFCPKCGRKVVDE